MAVTQDILATYRRPGAVLRGLLARGDSEPRALFLVMLACILVFVSQWPRLSREAFLTEQDLYPLLGGALLGWVVLAPLMLYCIAGLSFLVMRLLRQKVTGYATRLALFWSFLASIPVLLLHGMVAGFIGEGSALTLVGLVWVAVFVWFWSTGLRVASAEAKASDREAS